MDFWSSYFGEAQDALLQDVISLAEGHQHGQCCPVSPATVLRFAMGYSPSAQRIDRDSFLRFVSLFGLPGDSGHILIKVVNNLFPNGMPAAWFHARMERKEAEKKLREKPAGSFLVRLGSQSGTICVSYKETQNDVKHILLCPTRDYQGFRLTSGNGEWTTMGHFLNGFSSTFSTPVKSDSSRIFAEFMILSASQKRFGYAQDQASKDNAHGALEIVDELLLELDGMNPKGFGATADSLLLAKICRLRGDLLLRLGLGETQDSDVVASYSLAVQISERSMMIQALLPCKEGSHPLSSDYAVRLGFAPVLSSAHEALAKRSFKKCSPTESNKGLYHVSQMLANTSELGARWQVRSLWAERLDFSAALQAAGWSQTSVADMLQEGIVQYQKECLREASKTFEETVVQARCIGCDLLEARALGNSAIIYKRWKRYGEAICLYSCCLNVLRQLDEEGTYMKVRCMLPTLSTES
jgi:hypothetical protein